MLTAPPFAEKYSMFRRLLSVGIGVVASCAAPIESTAQSTQQASPQPAVLTELSLEALGQLEVVTASKTPETLWQTSAAISVMTQEDIRRSGATSLPELLRLVPGVQVARIDSDHWAVGVRGFNDSFSKSLLVLIDGRSIYTPLFAGVYWGVHDILIQDIDRIEVIRGPGGTIWGSNAVNGVINIITKPASQTRGTAVSAVTGNVNQGIGEVRFGRGNGQGLDYRISAKAFKRAPQFHSDGASWDKWWLGRVGVRADWEPSNSNAFTVQGDVYRGSNGQRVSVGVIFAAIAAKTRRSARGLGRPCDRHMETLDAHARQFAAQGLLRSNQPQRSALRGGTGHGRRRLHPQLHDSEASQPHMGRRRALESRTIQAGDTDARLHASDPDGDFVERVRTGRSRPRPAAVVRHCRRED